jgi:hypothetical protein
VRERILRDFPDAKIRVSVVWIEMLPTDSLDAARAMASEMSDPRVRHFYDPRGTRLAGAALAHGIIGEGRGPAWDVYLFYDSDAHWGDEPPVPVDWCHQLSGGQRADPSRYAGGIVGDRLHEAMRKLTATTSSESRGPR